jgi:6-bladed beta-propeller
MNVSLLSINRSLCFFAIIVVFSACVQRDNKTASEKKVLSKTDSIKKKNNEPFIIDLGKKYSERKMTLQDVAEIEYVALETSDDVLISYGPVSISDNHIIASNSSGQFMVFDRDGHILTHFNHKGGSGEEYKNIKGWAYDEQKDELYVLDMPSLKRIFVYSSNGLFKRKLNIPTTCKIEKLSNFNDSTLLAKKTYMYDYLKNINHTNEKDYVLLSKKDGRIVSTIDISLSNRIPTVAIRKGNGEYLTFMVPNDIINSGEYTVIADISSDTIYKLHQNNQLTPFIIRKPSVHDTKPVLLFEASIITDKYVFFSKHSYDYDSEDAQGITSTEEFAFDRYSKECFCPNFYNADFPKSEDFTMYGFRKITIGKNRAAKLIKAEDLTEALKNGELSGQLKKIASTIHEEDNPVVMILRFKE